MAEGIFPSKQINRIDLSCYKAKMPRIFLIRTGASPTIDAKVTQPLGLLYIASSLSAVADNDVYILDLKLEPLPTEKIIDILKEIKPDIIGFSVLPLDAPYFNKLSKSIKNRFPNIPMIAGGVYPTFHTSELFKESPCDFAVIGEGEESTCKLVLALTNGKESPSVPGTAKMVEGELVICGKRQYINNLDSLPFPLWDKICVPGYFDVQRTFPIYARKEYMSIFTSRGCPFRCSFCHNMFGSSFKARSPENVFSEIELLYKNYGIREIQIVDDCFNYDIVRSKKICDLIIESGMDIAISFPNGIRGDIIDDELIYKLKRAGAYSLCFGVQSASLRIQAECGSNIDLDRLAQAVCSTDRYGMIAYAYCMIGFAGETDEELYKTLNYVKRNRFHGATFFFATPYLGTRMYEQLRQNERVNRDSKGVTDYRFTPGISSKLSSKRLLRFQLYANISIYFSIWRVMRLLYLIPNKRVLARTFFLYLKRIMLFASKSGHMGRT